MDQKIVFFTLIGMALVTFIPRIMPLILLSSRQLPQAVVIWLRYVPAAVLAAMLFPALMLRDGKLDLGFGNPFLWAALPAFFIAWKTKSFFGTVVTGIFLVALWRYCM